MEMHERVARLEEHQIEQDRRIDIAEKLSDSINNLTTEIKVMNNNMTNQMKEMHSDITEVKTEVQNLDSKVEELENRPAQNSQKILIWLLGLIGAAMVGGIINIVATAIL